MLTPTVWQLFLQSTVRENDTKPFHTYAALREKYNLSLSPSIRFNLPASWRRKSEQMTG